MRVNQQSGPSDGLVTRLGAWFVRMAKSLTGQTEGDPTEAGAGLDPTHSGEATVDPNASLTALTSGLAIVRSYAPA